MTEFRKRRHPHLLEINAALFLRRLSEKYKKKLTFISIPKSEWETFAAQGFDFIWLMGVWKRSPGAREKALAEPAIKKKFDEEFSGWKQEDIAGSPYAVYEYTLDPALGAPGDLAQLKTVLHSCGLGLILDFVPNHLALDNPGLLQHPESFIQGTQEDLKQHPALFYKNHGKIFAHGRDPFFPPWTDTVQTNYFSAAWRHEASKTLLRIAEMADGVRCDMAMLGLSRIFENTWGHSIKMPRPSQEFWSETIQKVRGSFPGFLFIAEVYWDLEWELQQLGFDYTYDKKLYDKLLNGPSHDLRGHLNAETAYQNKSVRFIENHDENRAVTAFGREQSQAAAAVIATLPGLRFFHDGQLQGRTKHVPVQFLREPAEKPDLEMENFYGKLFTYASQPALHEGHWEVLDISPAWDANGTYHRLLAWNWKHGKQLRIIAVNMASSGSQGRILFPGINFPKKIKLEDKAAGRIYEPDAEEVRQLGLYIDLGPWKYHLLETEIP